ncbi:MAG: hypothetical protein KAJ14_12790, partial [Candidatus Omnitrophica bacterium]|nr:hypothetical protein [Candidatus Omnitrophota bacterium]
MMSITSFLNLLTKGSVADISKTVNVVEGPVAGVDGGKEDTKDQEFDRGKIVLFTIGALVGISLSLLMKDNIEMLAIFVSAQAGFFIVILKRGEYGIGLGIGMVLGAIYLMPIIGVIGGGVVLILGLGNLIGGLIMVLATKEDNDATDNDGGNSFVAEKITDNKLGQKVRVSVELKRDGGEDKALQVNLEDVIQEYPRVDGGKTKITLGDIELIHREAILNNRDFLKGYDESGFNDSNDNYYLLY